MALFGYYKNGPLRAEHVSLHGVNPTTRVRASADAYPSGLDARTPEPYIAVHVRADGREGDTGTASAYLKPADAIALRDALTAALAEFEADACDTAEHDAHPCGESIAAAAEHMADTLADR